MAKTTKYFTRRQADKLVGSKIELHTTGEVVARVTVADGEYALLVRWDKEIPERFTKEQWEQFL